MAKLFRNSWKKLSSFEDKFFDAGKSVKEDVTEDGVDPDQLEMGMKVEMEHTDCEEVAKKITLDHLAEFPDYYTRLKKMEDSK